MVVMGRNPMGSAAGRIIIISPDPDPAPIAPFIVTRDPDRPAIGRCPALIVCPVGRGRTADTDIEVNGGSRF
jgi:hypothetical protein